jgi:hypothetical protein
MRTDALTPSPAAVCDHERDLEEDEDEDDEDDEDDDDDEDASAARGVGRDEAVPVEEAAAASGNCCEAMCHAF